MLPEKVLQDKFFFPFKRICPLISKLLFCEDTQERRSDKVSGKMEKVRTMSGTTLCEVRIDEKASPNLSGLAGHGSKPKDNYMLM